MAGRAVTIDLSIEELLSLLDRLDLSPPAWFDCSVVTDLPPESRAAVAAAARRSLRARAMVDGEQVVAPIRSLLDLLCGPQITIALLVAGMPSPTRAFVGDPAIAVDHQALPDSVHRLVALPTEDLLARVADAAGLADQPSAPGPSFHVDSSLLAEAVLPDTSNARALLVAAGLPASSAESIATAVAERGGGRCIEATYLERVGRVAGGQLAWIDGGEAGIWQIDPGVVLGAGRSTVEVSPASAESLLEELRTYLPGGPDS